MNVWIVHTADHHVVGVFTTQKRALAAMVHTSRNTSVAVHIVDLKVNEYDTGEDDDTSS